MLIILVPWRNALYRQIYMSVYRVPVLKRIQQCISFQNSYKVCLLYMESYPLIRLITETFINVPFNSTKYNYFSFLYVY
jgi:hypothetical protein